MEKTIVALEETPTRVIAHELSIRLTQGLYGRVLAIGPYEWYLDSVRRVLHHGFADGKTEFYLCCGGMGYHAVHVKIQDVLTWIEHVSVPTCLN